MKNLVESKIETIKSSQNILKQQVEHYKINTQNVELLEKLEDELRSALVEIILEGLCWTTPKILDKNEAGYVSA